MMTVLSYSLVQPVVIEREVLRRQDDCSSVQLESLCRHYFARAYTLCRRLLANPKAAEAATVEVFVRFSHELPCWWDEAHNLARLRALSIVVALEQLSRGDDAMVLEEVVVGRGPNGWLASRPREPAPGVMSASLDPDMFDGLTDRLPMNMRVAFVLHDVEGLGHAVVATHLQIGETKLRLLLHAARLELLRLWRSHQPAVTSDP